MSEVAVVRAIRLSSQNRCGDVEQWRRLRMAIDTLCDGALNKHSASQYTVNPRRLLAIIVEQSAAVAGDFIDVSGCGYVRCRMASWMKRMLGIRP